MNKILQVTAVAMLAFVPLAANADTVLDGNTFYSYDFQDGTAGQPPLSTNGDLDWVGVGDLWNTVVQEDPVDAANLALRSDGQDTGDGRDTGRRVRFSAAMASQVPTAGSVSFRFYFDQIFHVTSFREANIFLAMDNINGNVSGPNMTFGLMVDPTDDPMHPGRILLASNNSWTNVGNLVEDEWFDAKIDYDLLSTTDNVTVTLSSPTFGSSSTTISSDLTGKDPDGFYIFNSGPGTFNTGEGASYLLDDINWQVAVPGADGDFDSDGDVDGADFLKWQRDDGDAGTLSDWQSSYGNGNLTASLSAVPEPSSCLLLLLGAAAMASRRRS